MKALLSWLGDWLGDRRATIRAWWATRCAFRGGHLTLPELRLLCQPARRRTP